MQIHRSGLHFDPATHTYWVNGERLLSVTQILSIAGLIDSRWYSIEKSRLGTQIHHLTEKYDQGTLVWDAIPDKQLPYLNAYRQFRQDTSIEIIAIEQPCYSPSLRIAGTIDRICLFDTHRSIIDIKTGQKTAWHPLQTAGYSLILSGHYERFSLYLLPSGNYRLIEHRNPMDSQVMLAAHSVAQWKVINGYHSLSVPGSDTYPSYIQSEQE